MATANKAVIAAVKTITKLQPSAKERFDVQRAAEKAIGKLKVVDPRCRVNFLDVESFDGQTVPVRIFTPLDIDFSLKKGLHAKDRFRGTILFFHGGGWTHGDIDLYTDACCRTALELERRVVTVDYRRSPEYRFPTAAEDCYEIARKLFAGEILDDVDPDCIALFGDSAGGDLSAVVSLMARDRGEFLPKNQILLYPLTYNDHSLASPFDSIRENGEDYLLTREDIQDYANMYLKNPEDRNNPYFAPLLMPDLSDQPRTLMITAEFCPLRDEGETYAARLQDDGNDVQCFRMKDGIHGYLLYPGILNLVHNTYTIMKYFLDGGELARGEDLPWIELLATS